MSDTAAACPHCGAPAAAASAGLPADGRSRRHGVIGKLYIVLCYLGVVMFAFTALTILVLPLTSEPRIRETAEPVQVTLAFGAVVLLLIACARGVRRFRRWGWWLATGVSVLAVLSCIGVMLMPTEADAASVRTGALLVIAFHAVFLVYFWSRRRDFGIGT
ncbi:hypothetical protein [Longimicrobium sp.]|uniref:hypothetical protein n=1 Tax=Longimicrobium sp. TaxID=2029185 RepID=UPI003B3A4A84